MKIWLKQAIFINRAPFENFTVDFAEDEIAVLSAVNGRGKTTLISHLVDAFHEMARPNFQQTFAGKENKYYRVTSPINALDRSKPSIVYFRFGTRDIATTQPGGHAQINDSNFDYIDVSGKLTSEQYNSAISIDGKIPFSDFEKILLQDNNVKKITSFDTEKAKKVFGSNLVTYFPSYRYEEPGYLNDTYQVQLSFSKAASFSGFLPNPIEVISGLPQIANWMMDIALDLQYGDQTSAPQMNRRINTVLTRALASKNFGDLRFGIGQRGFGGTRLQIVRTDNDLSVYPTIFNLSAGEAAMLCLFGEILRQSDSIMKGGLGFDQITGIVAIDEIDKHLHIKIQKECLPKLLELFPKIQFIVSSHSPFLNMGLAQDLPSRSKIIDLESSGISSDPTTNDLYQEVYEMMILENERFREGYLKLAAKAAEGAYPLIVTEGKTDVQHLKAASAALGIADLKLEYYEVDETLGDSKLKNMLEQLSRIPQRRKVIGIFDRDVEAVVKEMERGGATFKDYGNEVFAFCLPIPAGRESYTNISIEFFYSDVDLKRSKDGKCLYFDNELKIETPVAKRKEKTIVRLDAPLSDVESAKKLFDENLGELTWAHSKSRFADLVQNDVEFSKDINFENFRKIFDRIRSIIDGSGTTQ